MEFNHSHIFTIDPGIYSGIGKLSEIVSLRAKKQASLRVKFGDYAAPSGDFVVIQNHLPRPVMEPYHQDPVVWVMPEENQATDINVVFSQKLTGSQLSPEFGPLDTTNVARVGVAYKSNPISALSPPKSIGAALAQQNGFNGRTVEFAVIDGNLPPGLALQPVEAYAGNDPYVQLSPVVMSGTPTTAGTYIFTVALLSRQESPDAFGNRKPLLKGTYSITVSA